MSAAVEYEAANIIAPVLNGSGAKARTRILAIEVTDTSARVDLSTLIAEIGNGHYLTAIADGGDVYFALNNADAGAVDETAVDDAVTVAWKLPADQPQHFRLVQNFHWLIAKTATGTAQLRLYVSGCVQAEEVL
jgi:hypothetical protein